MTVLAAPEPISPELVLVSPPEVAQLARSLLPIPRRIESEPGRIELAAIWLFSLAMTLGPMLFILAVQS